MAKKIEWTEEQIKYLQSRKNENRELITADFNIKFNRNYKKTTIKGLMQRKGFNSENDGRFKKGDTPWNKGMRGEEYFNHYDKEKVVLKMRKMHEINRTAKIGEEFVYNGVPYIRTEAGKRTVKFGGIMRKRDYVWRLHNGDKPKGHCIVHLDGNHLNCEIENLRCIPRKYMTLLMKNGWFSKNPTVTDAAIKWCDHYYAIKNIQGGSNGRKTNNERVPTVHQEERL